MSRRKTCDFLMHDGWFLVAHTTAAPSRGEWNEYLAYCRENIQSIRGVLVSSEGGAPDSLQREEMQTSFRHLNTEAKVAVLSRAVTVRMAVTAISWFDKNIHAFNPDDVPGAMAYLGVPEGERARLVEVLTRLKAELAASASAA